MTVPDGGNGEEMSYLKYWGTDATKKVWVLLNRRLTEDLEVPFLKIATKASTLDYQNEGTWFEGAINEATKVTLGDPEVVKLTVRAGENVSETGMVLDPLEANEGTFEHEMRYDVDLLPVEVESMDKFLAGSFDESIIETFGGETSFGLEFRNPSSGENYRFNSIADAYVYDNPYADTEEGEDAFLSDEEVAMGASGSDSEGRLSQDVIFYKQNGNLHFRTIFDQAGEIEIAILKDGEEIGAVTHELVEDEDIGDLIDTIDEVLSDEWGDGGPVILAAQSASFSTAGDEPQFAQARQGGRRGHYRYRNATTKVTMSIWDRIKHNFNEGVRRTTEAATRAIRTAALTGKGFVEGAWMGIKDDAHGLVELVKMVANPTETAKSFYEAFKALMSLDLEGWKNVGLTMVESFLNKGKEGAGEWVQPDNFDVAAYLAGYTSGYIVEQAVITYVTAGGAQALKAGKIGGKIGALVRAAAKRVQPALAKTADNAMRVASLKAKNSIFRRVSQDVLSDADVKKLKSILQELEFECPLLAAP
ncbi:hypothetical protein HNR46_004243 [Haloferula luteola]|uniref:Uncharacterized protein n=1 Tax=Haloferula luteola TaxID=595692 RepID=A0A840V7L4_9BACT|nr:hypothetical protein [Haloferula luteola]